MQDVDTPGERVNHVYGAGVVLGAAEVLRRGVRVSTARTRSTCRALVVDRAALDSLVRPPRGVRVCGARALSNGRVRGCRSASIMRCSLPSSTSSLVRCPRNVPVCVHSGV